MLEITGGTQFSEECGKVLSGKDSCDHVCIDVPTSSIPLSPGGALWRPGPAALPFLLPSGSVETSSPASEGQLVALGQLLQLLPQLPGECPQSLGHLRPRRLFPVPPGLQGAFHVLHE